MVMDSSPPTPGSVSNGGMVNSPHSRWRSLPSPWASIVRGDSEQNSSPTAAAALGASPGSSSLPVEQSSSDAAADNTVIEILGSETQPESSDFIGDANADPPRRPAWNRPSNGVVEPASVIGGVASWPALSESTRPIPRSPSDISRPVSDGSATSWQAPIISQPPQRPTNNSSAHGNSTGNNPPSRQRLRNRGGGGGNGGHPSGSGPSQSTFNQSSLPMPPPFPVFEVPYGIIPVLDNSVRGGRPIGGVGASQSHVANDYSSQRNNSRRGGYGARSRGGGGYHNSHGGRRDQDRRDAHHPPQYVPPPMGYMPPPLPPGAGPFMAPPHMRIFPGQLGFDMTSPFYYVPPMPPESFRAMPMVPPLAPMIFPHSNENPLTSAIIKQIDFYFSDDNLVKDSFLRSKMDDHGWVPIGLIASFRRVQQLTKDIPLILESLRYSTVVEVQGDKVRRHNEWSKWLLSSGLVNSDSGPRTLSSAPENALATSLHEVSLDNSTNAYGSIDAKGHMELAAGQFPEESTARSALANGDDSRSPPN